MHSRRPIAILICIFLLSGQIASALHAVEHFYPEIPGNHAVFDYEGYKHKGHEHYDFSVASEDDRPGERQDGVSCLVYHFHGSAQAFLPAPNVVPVRNNTTAINAEVFAQMAIEATASRLTIRGPPVIS